MTHRFSGIARTTAVIAALMIFAACDKKGEQAAQDESVPTQSAITSPVGFVWKWEGTQTPVERIVPPDPTRYTLEFLPDTTVAAQIDCNRGHGKYTLNDQAISIGPLATTRMACPPGSLDGVFSKQLEAARHIFFRGDTLFMDLFADSGTMKFSQMPEPPQN